MSKLVSTNICDPYQIEVFEDEEQGAFRAKIKRLDGKPLMSGGKSVAAVPRENQFTLETALEEAKLAIKNGAVQ